MISSLFLVFLALCCVYVFSGARHALPLILLIGFSQDMVRKVTPGEPIIFIVTVGVLFGSILLGIWARRGFIDSMAPFLSWTDSIREPLLVFVLILIGQLIYSIARYNNVVVAFIGLTTYLAPFLAVIVGYFLANSVESIRTFLKLYVVCGTVVAVSVVAEFMGVESAVLKEVGKGLVIYDQGTVLRSHAGILRSGEVAAWHIAATACLIMTLSVTSTKQRSILIPLVLVALLILVITLTGRRKMVMLTVLFLAGYSLALLYYRKTLNARYFFGFMLIGSVFWLGLELLSLDGYSRSLRDYIARGSSVFGDATGRFVQLGINPIQWAFNRVGILGGGLGIASQGNYLFNVAKVAGGSGEGGLGKIMVELGLQGLVCVVWLGFALARHVDKSIRLSLRTREESRLFPLILSFAVLLFANAVTFSVATQVYGDIFILLLLGLFGGFIFAVPKIVVSTLTLTVPRQATATPTRA